VDLLGLKPEGTMMVAAHSGDLNAARGCGLLAGFIYRPNEHGPGGKADKAKPSEFDVVASSMLDLASQLGA
jgi:2-haloacid dehalogenase